MSLRGGAEQSLACRLVTRPVHPLMAIDGAEVAPSRGEIWVIQNSRFESLRTDIVPGFAAITVERPVGPDAHALCDPRTDVGVPGQDRKSGVRGKSGVVRVDLGGRRYLKKNKKQN